LYICISGSRCFLLFNRDFDSGFDFDFDFLWLWEAFAALAQAAQVA